MESVNANKFALARKGEAEYLQTEFERNRWF